MKALVVLCALAGVASAESRCLPEMWGDPWPYLDRPADPWLAVAGGKPAAVKAPTDRTGKVPPPRALCDAAHDHCLRDCTWLLTESPTDRTAIPHHFDAAGVAWESTRYGYGEAKDGYVAYRTVPATRKNLKVGVLAMGIQGPKPHAGGDDFDDSRKARNEGPLSVAWDVGIVESIEWERGLVRFEGLENPYYLSGTRVAVLRYVAGGTVEKIEGVPAEAPALADVIAPGVKAAKADPWDQVGKDKQPLAASDAIPLAKIEADCTGKRDHCLRPWVWFVDVDHTPVAARWTGAKFVYAEDAERAIDKPGLAYRTRPATEAELAPGKKIVVFESSTPPASEDGAHYRGGWAFATVEKVDRYTKTMFVKGSSIRFPTDNARVLTLFWLPGEDAAPAE